MHEKLFSYRWDIDHRACMTDGIPNIQSVCKEFGIKNTFFVNMGRSTNLREWLGKGLKGSKDKFYDTQAINLVKKIGWRRFAVETLLSRPVGRSFIGPLQSLQSDQHELGLHGGSDHVIWSRRFGQLSERHIAEDVTETLTDFQSCFGHPAGFTSPGFRSDQRIMRLVEQLGFEYHGDAIGGTPGRTRINGESFNHWTMPVTICGPRTIPFFEWHAARGTAEKDVLTEFDKKLKSDNFAILYGHPCHEGLDRNMLRRVFEIVLKNGYRFVTHAEFVLDQKKSNVAGAQL
jgi:hypothetical protein